MFCTFLLNFVLHLQQHILSVAHTQSDVVIITGQWSHDMDNSIITLCMCYIIFVVNIHELCTSEQGERDLYT